MFVNYARAALIALPVVAVGATGLACGLMSAHSDVEGRSAVVAPATETLDRLRQTEAIARAFDDRAAQATPAFDGTPSGDRTPPTPAVRADDGHRAVAITTADGRHAGWVVVPDERLEAMALRTFDSMLAAADVARSNAAASNAAVASMGSTTPSLATHGAASSSRSATSGLIGLQQRVRDRTQFVLQQPEGIARLQQDRDRLRQQSDRSRSRNRASRTSNR